VRAIGGNIAATLAVKGDGGRSTIGERITTWTTVAELVGFLDLAASGGSYSSFTGNAKLQDSSHVFICDYQPLPYATNECRLVIGDQIYQVQLLDNPMGLCEHWEIYLKYLEGDVDRG